MYDSGIVSDRIPPQDEAAEESVLGAMMLSKEAIADVVASKIRPSDFYFPKHETIYNAIMDLNGRGEPADIITVSGELQRLGLLSTIGGAEYLHTLVSGVPSTRNVSHYARIVWERSALRGLVEAGTRITQLGYADDGGDVDDIINAAQQELYRVTEKRNSEDYHRVSEIYDDIIAQIQQSERGPEYGGVPTGFKDLDDLLRGLHPGQMIIVAARPAMGKSTLALDFCRSASIHHQRTSVIFSLEMSREEIIKRMLAAESEVELSRINSGKLFSEHWDAIVSKADAINAAPLFIDDSPNMSMPEIRAKCRRLKQQENLSLVVVDYLQLMSSNKRVESRQQEVSEMSRSLKLLAKELEVPVVAVAQLNRGPEQRNDRVPMMSDLRESGSLEQDADVVLLLHRPDFYNPDNRPGDADVIVAKHRNGATKTVPLMFQGHFARFSEHTDTPEPPAGY